jgi:hypothetical protein
LFEGHNKPSLFCRSGFSVAHGSNPPPIPPSVE